VQDQLSIFVALLGGTFSFLSRCVLPLFRSYLSFITGMSVEDSLGCAVEDSEAHSAKFAVVRFRIFNGFHRHGRFRRVFGRRLTEISQYAPVAGRTLGDFLWSLQILKGKLEQPAAPRDSRTHGSYRALHDLGGLVVGEFFHINENYCAAILLGQRL
jgi:cytochrome c-type biogenesis protein